MDMKPAFSFLPHTPLMPDALFWGGLTLFLAGLCGELGWRIWRLPRITGYGVVGLIVGNAGFDVIDAAYVAQAKFLLKVVLGLLLFELGSRTNFRWIRKNPWLVATSFAEATLTFILVTIVMHFLHFTMINAMIAASIAMATSPSMIIQIKGELKSDGQVTERLFVLTALNSVYAIVLLKFVSAWLHQSYYNNVFASIVELLYWLVLSLVLAYALARGCNFLYRRFDMQEHAFVMLFGLVLLTLSIAGGLNLSTVLTLLVAGMLFKNLDERVRIWPTHFGTAGWLLAVISFVTVPMSFEWKFMTLGGFAACVLIIVRFLAKFAVVMTLARPSGINIQQAIALSFALLPMSALAYLLVEDTYALYPTLDPDLYAMLQCSIVILQIFAPLLVHRGLSFAGERRQ
jgi:Kef-type K+ transport system membrane component KefB